MSYQIGKRGLTGTFRWIWIEDPALDVPTGDDGEPDEDALIEKYRLYSETDDRSHLPVKPGSQPVEWTLRYLTAREQRYVADIWADKKRSQALWKAAQLSIKAVDAKDEENRAVVIKRAPDAEGFACAPDTLLEALEGSEETQGLVDAIGSVAMTRSRPGPK